eukprot:IDg19025t1
MNVCVVISTDTLESCASLSSAALNLDSASKRPTRWRPQALRSGTNLRNACHDELLESYEEGRTCFRTHAMKIALVKTALS